MFTLHCLKIKQTTSLVRTQTRMTSIFSRGLQYFFKKNLLFTNCITSGGFLALGDLIQQEFEYRAKLLPERYDWLRVQRMFIVGTLLGPLHHYYYIYMDKLLPKYDLRTVFIKIASDQTIVSPLTIVLFFYGMGILERKTSEQSMDEVKNKFKYVYLGDWLFWPPVQFVNFYYLKTEYRVFYINFATMIFNVFLSYMKHDFQH